MTDHILKSTVETVHWGYFAADVAPVMTIAPGDRVRVETLSGGPDVMPAPGTGHALPPELPEIHAKVPRKLGVGHLLTGPIAIKGAMPGDALEIDIEKIELRQTWGYNAIRPLAGALALPCRRLLDEYRARTQRLCPGASLPAQRRHALRGVGAVAGRGTEARGKRRSGQERGRGTMDRPPAARRGVIAERTGGPA